MANNVRAWSTTAASNGTADPDINAAEGCPPSAVNDAERQMMAKLKNTLLTVEYLDHGYTATFATTTTFASPGDLTAVYLASRRLKFDCGSTLYGTIRSASYVATNTTVTVVMDNGTTLSSSLSAVYVGSTAPTNVSMPPNFLKFNGATTSGTSTAYTATFVPGLAALETGLEVVIDLHTTCGAAPTFAPDGLTAKSWTKNGGSDVASGDFNAGAKIRLRYDASLKGGSGAWETVGAVPPAGSGSPYTIQTADFTAAAGGKYVIDCTAAAKTITMPTTPANTDSPIVIKKAGGRMLSIDFGAKKLRMPTGDYATGVVTFPDNIPGDLNFQYLGTVADTTTNVWSV